MKRVAIIGAGISGLSAAYYLERERRAGADLQWTLYEAGDRLGGVMRTDHVEGFLVEAGPDSFLTEKPAAAQLCQDLGIADQLIGSNDELRKTFIVLRDRLIAIPDGLMFMVPTKIWPILTTPLFSLGSKLRMAREWFQRETAAEDESVATFVSRHFGEEMVERLAEPLLAGVYGGEADQLSVRAVLPRFAEMERNHGSLSRAMLAARREGKMRHTPRPLFTSLRDGMQQLVDAIGATLDAAVVQKKSPIAKVARSGTNWRVSRGRNAVAEFDAVILAVPAYHAAKLLRESSQELAEQLARIRYSSSVTVALGYEAKALSSRERGALDDGFGFLVPAIEGRRILAATFVRNKFPHRVPDGGLLLRVVLSGGSGEGNGLLELSDEQILAAVRHDLKQILGLRAGERFARVYRWRQAMAQYDVGHLERVAEIERLRQQLPGLRLAGNAYSGIGVPDCIRTGKEAALSLIEKSAAA